MPLRSLLLVASLVLLACSRTLPPAADAAPSPGPHRQIAKNTSPAPDVQPEPASPFVRDARAERVLAHVGLVEARVGLRFQQERTPCLASLLAQLGEVERTARERRFDLRAAAFDDPGAESTLFAELRTLADKADRIGSNCGMMNAAQRDERSAYGTRVRDPERAQMSTSASAVSYHGGAPIPDGVFFGGNVVAKPKPLGPGGAVFGGAPQGTFGGVQPQPQPAGGGTPPAVAKPPVASPGRAGVHDGSMLLRSAQITLAVFEVEKKMDAVQAAATEVGGYLALRGDRELTVRVPRERFDETLKRVEALGDVLHRSVAAEDVTDQYVDLELRLKNAEAVRSRLEKLLENAIVKDAVEIHKELAKVTEEIERLSGKLKLLRDRIAFSTITVTFERSDPQRLRSQALLPFPWMRTMGLSPLLQVSR